MAERTTEARPRRTRTVVTLAVAGVVAAALVVGVVAAVRWWTQPDLFRDHGADLVLEPRPTGRAKVHVAVTFPSIRHRDDVTLTFRDVEARFSTNTAGAEATFWVCSGEATAGAVGGPLRKVCGKPERIEAGTRMTYSSKAASDHVVVTLVPSGPGVARLDRVELDYALGAGSFYRRGTDTVDLDVTLRTR